MEETELTNSKDAKDNVPQTLQTLHSNLAWLSNPYLKAATADNTRIAYRSDVRHFERWGGLLPASTESIINYLQHYATSLNPRTLARRVTAIKQWHHYQGFPDPTSHPAVGKTLKGIFRLEGKPPTKAHPLTIVELQTLVETLQAQTSLASRRDEALLQVGYFGGFRRSELINIKVEDLHWVEEGVDVIIPHSKTDKESKGQAVALPYGTDALCPVSALKSWLAIAGITSGLIFRSVKKGNQLQQSGITPSSVNLIMKRRASECGLTSLIMFSSRSLRRGITTAASRADSTLISIMRHGRWKNVNTVMEYIDSADRFKENIATAVIATLKKK
jgi:integrase